MRPLRLNHEKLLATSPRHLRFRLRLTPVKGDLKPESLRLSLINGTREPQVYSANRVGAFDVSLASFTHGDETLMEISPRCDGGFAVGAELAVAGGHGGVPDSQTIRIAMDEYDQLIATQGLLIRMFAPKLRTLVVRFPLGHEGECTGWTRGEARPYRVNENFELKVSLKDYFQYDRFSCRTAPEEFLLSADR